MTEPTNPSPEQPSQTPPVNPVPPAAEPAAAASTSTPSVFDQADIDQNKVMGVLAYIGILWLVPLLAAPKSPFAKFHANQGLNLFLVSVGAAIAASVIAIVPIIGWILGCLAIPAIMIGSIALMVIGIINAANGQAKKLPVVGGLFTLIK